MLFNTVAEYDLSIKETQEAIRKVIKDGHLVTLTASDTSQSVQKERLDVLERYLSKLQREKLALQTGRPSGGVYLGAGW